MARKKAEPEETVAEVEQVEEVEETVVEEEPVYEPVLKPLHLSVKLLTPGRLNYQSIHIDLPDVVVDLPEEFLVHDENFKDGITPEGLQYLVDRLENLVPMPHSNQAETNNDEEWEDDNEDWDFD